VTAVLTSMHEDECRGVDEGVDEGVVESVRRRSSRDGWMDGMRWDEMRGRERAIPSYPLISFHLISPCAAPQLQIGK
jgi:hypothetical protein